MPKKRIKYKNIKKLLFIFLIIFIIYNSFFSNFLERNKKEYNFSTILKKNLESLKSNQEIRMNNKSFFLVTKDGVTLYDTNLNIKWNYTLNMAYDPIITENDNYLCVGEYKGKNLYVFDLHGLCYEKSFDYPILNFSINSRGYSSVILENKEHYIIYVNDEKGNILTKGEMQDKNIFPITTAISKNNKILAISFLDTNNSLNSKIFFYYIKEKEAEGLLDNMFSSILNLEEQIVGKIKFMYDNTFVGISDKQVVAIEMGKNNNTKIKWSIDFFKKAKYADFIKDKFIFLVFEENENNIENNLEFYNLKGKIIGKYNIKDKITFVKNNFNNLVLKLGNSNKKVYGINNKGKFLFEYKDIKDIKYINFIENNNKILVVTPTELKIIQKN